MPLTQSELTAINYYFKEHIGEFKEHSLLTPIKSYMHVELNEIDCINVIRYLENPQLNSSVTGGFMEMGSKFASVSFPEQQPYTAAYDKALS